MPLPEENKTKFAPPQRSSNNEIISSKEKVISQRLLVEAINAFPDLVMILDENRQIIYCNHRLLGFLSVDSLSDVIGKRPGEAFRCVNSCIEEPGCGTSLFCRECGAVKAILNAQKDNEDVQECRIHSRLNDNDITLDLRVWAVPINIDGQRYVVFTVKDVADEKRREVLERIFFHDILNDTALLKGYTDNIKDGIFKHGDDVLGKVSMFTNRIIDAIRQQRDLMLAEEGNLVLSEEEFSVFALLNELVDSYRHSPLALSRKIILDCAEQEAVIKTDRVIFWRIISNFLKNALEASEENDTVTVNFKVSGGKSITSVHNSQVMPENVRLQVFQRSFTTKGKGRGLGTYSAMLFGERYLKGYVGFESKEGQGTTFYFSL